MKALFFTIVLALFSTFACAQTIAYAETPASGAAKNSQVANVTAATITSYNQEAFRQIGKHLATNLSYPADMTEYTLEGTVTAAVVLDSRGGIARIDIVKSNLPDSFGQEVITSLRNLGKLNFDSTYQGNSVLYVPVHFSL